MGPCRLPDKIGILEDILPHAHQALHLRRSLYFFVKRVVVPPWLGRSCTQKKLKKKGV
jgi:hypothetical protein